MLRGKLPDQGMGSNAGQFAAHGFPWNTPCYLHDSQPRLRVRTDPDGFKHSEWVKDVEGVWQPVPSRRKRTKAKARKPKRAAAPPAPRRLEPRSTRVVPEKLRDKRGRWFASEGESYDELRPPPAHVVTGHTRRRSEEEKLEAAARDAAEHFANERAAIAAREEAAIRTRKARQALLAMC